ncbi:cytochrome d ubiquinol oxidase subunit II [Solwaraspora sp. WMMD1047]|uniref:cytochrome d ubiquinol oxidase subunit II n=1 Tax=Solwaraspora sp. WMMD1047 TaxID=3016102 RepID=UPI00241778C0|nr:cytochrome d ubiquinol oxidase subunit II [Solwaraspora sp. WMMD1047]MDG4833356.1 cytochrome d ubiquinol oxidase subunit II [Solwaraspora sp. WMMD1047]
MEILWYGLLGLFFAGYLVLGGFDYGVGILLARTPATGSADPRRAALTALGPFLLGNEVWLVAAVGILFGAFPLLEGELLAGLYPAIAVALAGVITVIAAVGLRSRPAGQRARTRWDRIIVVGSVLAAGGWGAALAGLLQGVPVRADGHLDGIGHLFTPFVAAAALALSALVTLHGAAFLALRLPPGAADQHVAVGRRLVPVTLAALGAAAVLAGLSGPVRQSVRQPAVGVLGVVLLAATVLAAGRALGRRRTGVAFALTATAVALPVLLVGAANWPYALVSTADPAASLTVAEAAASEPTLRVLTWLLVPLLPALLGFQLMSWWVFRGRIDERAPVYW